MSRFVIPAKFRWFGDERVNSQGSEDNREVFGCYLFAKRLVLQLLLGLRKRIEGVLGIYGNGTVGNTV
jgi:hypothetical protein